MVEYLFIFVFQIIGILLSVIQVIVDLDSKNPGSGFKTCFTLFMKHDWDTLMRSGVILLLHLCVHGLFDYYEFTTVLLADPWYGIVNAGFALLLGYGGQRIVYSALGKAEAHINDKLNNLK